MDLDRKMLSKKSNKKTWLREYLVRNSWIVPGIGKITTLATPIILLRKYKANNGNNFFF